MLLLLASQIYVLISKPDKQIYLFMILLYNM